MKHKKRSKSETQYIRGIIQNLSLQRWTDHEIVDFFHNEKNIDIARTTVNTIKNQIVKQAEKWYIELRNSRYKYIATYKERIDSLFSYQKKLQDIISTSKKEEVHLRAVSELHAIEISIFNIWKQLPSLEIIASQNDTPTTFYKTEGCACATSGHDIISDCKCRHCLTVWCPIALKQDWCPNPDCSSGTRGSHFKPYDENYEWIRCLTCERWFKTQEILDAHNCQSTANPPAIDGFEDDEDGSKLKEYLEKERIEFRKRAGNRD